MKFTQLTILIAVINCASINKRGLGLTTINSPEVNQQQDLETNENWGFGSNGMDNDNTWTSNSFNNVGGLDNLNVVSGFGPTLGGFLFKRNMNLNSWASPVVNQEQNLQGNPGFEVDQVKRRIPVFIN